MASQHFDYQYHYWFHLGEARAIRQMLGHTDLPQFVGDMSEALTFGSPSKHNPATSGGVGGEITW